MNAEIIVKPDNDKILYVFYSTNKTVLNALILLHTKHIYLF